MNYRETTLEDDDMLGIYFCQNFELLGTMQEYELKPNGSNIKVTEENKEEYLT